MEVLRKYAELLCTYCLDVKPGERVYIVSTYLAEPLVKELIAAVARAGGRPETQLAIQEQDKTIIENSSKEQLNWTAPFRELAFQEFECYINIDAPFNLRESQHIDADKRTVVRKASAHVREAYHRRTANGEMRRTLCLFPTQASAQEAGMSLSEYQQFVYEACHLHADDPKAEWLKVDAYQQGIVDHLNGCSDFRYRNKNFDISFSAKDRTWINSNGKTNMPSGEVFTAPVEDSVNGTVHFSFPGIYQGQDVEGITLEVKRGEVVRGSAKQGQKVLDRILAIPGANRFGEAAIGTNTSIKRMTRNTLFDEKIGGTIHMALGQAYRQCGGKNESSVHWDLITDMRDGGEIYADDELIYRNGEFLIR